MQLAYDASFLRLHSTGIGQYLRQLVCAAAQLGDDTTQHVLLLEHESSIAAKRMCWPGNVIQRYNPDVATASIRDRLWWEQWVLPRTASNVNADVLLIPHINFPVLSRLPVILVVHDLSVIERPDGFGFAAQSYYRFLLQLAERHAAAIVTDSNFSADRIMHYFPAVKQRVHVIYPGVNAEFVESVTGVADKEKIARLGFPLHYVLYSGGLGSRKNLMRLIGAFAHAVKISRLSHALVLLGQGNALRAKLCERARALGIENRIIFPGYIEPEDMPAAYRCAAACTYVSLYEGFGFPVLEAMASGTRVVTSKDSSMAEIAAGNAILVDPYSELSISTGIIEALRDRDYSGRVLEAARVRAGLFTWENCASRTMRVAASCK